MRCPEIINGQVSIALGIASAENKDQLPEALKRSDERMYRNKSDQKELWQAVQGNHHEAHRHP